MSNYDAVKNIKTSFLKASLLMGAGMSILAMPQVAYAQSAEDDVEEIVVTGIRTALESAILEQRNSDNLVEVIIAEDIGKLPDQNLAEVLENITGVQITRQAGVGTGVQIRGTDDNRIEINGVGTVGSGNGRAGVSFEDIDASIIAGLEVTKAPEARTTEGSVGGTVNLRTIRPLDLKGPLASIRLQGEDSSLTTDGITPRISGALGKTWENAAGQEIGVVMSLSRTESDNSAFRPRLDRDNVTVCNGATPPSTCLGAPAGTTHFLGVQFLNQVQINQEYETWNFAGSVEATPTPNLKIFTDVVYNDQERRQESSRVQVSNISRTNGASDPTNGGVASFDTFGTFNLGSFPGSGGSQDLGSIVAVTSGSVTPHDASQGNSGRGAPFIRASMDSGSRLTETSLVRIGGEYEKDQLTIAAEVSKVKSETVNPNLSLTLNYINPRTYRHGDRDENGSPVRFDLRGDNIAFGFDDTNPLAPTLAELANPENYVMDSGGTFSANERENEEDTFRIDASYDTDNIEFINSVDFGYRYNKRTTIRDNIQASVGGTSSFANSLNGGAISSLLTPIPDNFGDGTGSNLFFANLLHFNPELAANPLATINTINAAIAGAGISQTPIGTQLASRAGEFFDIEEKTGAFYAQANFEHGMFRGNAGLRYVKTDFNNGTDPASSYDFVLPRINVVADVRDDIVLRAAYGHDINRPDFTSLTTARTFPGRGGVNDVSRIGNPNLKPEEIESFDVSASWYFAPRSFVSIGYFTKERSSLFGDNVDQPGGPGDVGVLPGFGRDTVGPDCEAGGIFSSNTDVGIFGSGRGVCVGDATLFNAPGTTKQSGIEMALQYDLGQFEDQLGWASGFGVIANYTIQEEDTNTGFTAIGESRALNIYDLQGFDRVNNPVTRETATLLNLSEDAYNLTAFYEKYGISARARYTWRSAYRTDDLPGTGNVFDPLGFRAVAEERGQLNASASYDLNDHITFSIDGVNLTEEDADVYCVNENALLCYKGITDRRVVFGASYTF